jgi:hypothetical protein
LLQQYCNINYNFREDGSSNTYTIWISERRQNISQAYCPVDVVERLGLEEQ